MVAAWALYGPKLTRTLPLAATAPPADNLGAAAQVTLLRHQPRRQLLVVGHANGIVCLFNAPASGVRPCPLPRALHVHVP